MPVSLQVSDIIDRPAADVFRFYAIEHVQNHPRWDPDMQLEKITAGPIGIGTVIKRLNSRSGTPVEGTMEIVEFEPNSAMGMVIHDGPVEMHGRAILEPESADRTKLIFDLEIPGMDETVDTSLLRSMMQRSVQNIKQFIESEG